MMGLQQLQYPALHRRAAVRTRASSDDASAASDFGGASKVLKETAVLDQFIDTLIDAKSQDEVGGQGWSRSKGSLCLVPSA